MGSNLDHLIRLLLSAYPHYDFMDFEYYGISRETRDKLLVDREAFFLDYWRDGRHFSKHKSKNKGFSSRVVDKNIYENLLRSFYANGSHYEYQGVFNGYRQNDFIGLHLDSKYILKVDFKNCYRNITYDHFSSVITPRVVSLQTQLPMDLVQAMYFPFGYLQAGLSASNIICDLVLKYNFDKEINSTVHQGSEVLANYSRYYDDLHISADNLETLQVIYETIKQISKDLFLPLNYQKCELRRTNGVKVLGSRIADGAIRIPRKEKNNLRAAIHELENTRRGDKTYEHRLRSVIYRLSRICRSEAEVNGKYADDLNYFRSELDSLVQGHDPAEVAELHPMR